MKRQLILASLAAFGLACPAAAEPARMAQAVMLPAHEIAALVRSAGFVPISPAMRRGETYVLRATNPEGREVRVVVNARRGEVISAAPVVPAAAGPGGDAFGPREFVTPGYIGPGVYEAGPPIVHQGDRPMNRPAAAIPNASPRSARIVPPSDQGLIAAPPPIIREERGEHGLLPPPPERFPQRAPPSGTAAPKPAAKPSPVKRAAAPDATPLPKPRPEAKAEPSEARAAPAAAPSEPTASSAPANGKVDPRSLPH